MICVYVAKYSQIIAEHLAPRYIQFPQNDVERSVVKTRFFQQYHFPGILGVVDGTHIAITAVSRLMENAYVNRSGYHSVNTQIACDADLKIININARFPGSSHDAFVYGGSMLNTHLEGLYQQNPRSLNFLIGNLIRILHQFTHIIYSHIAFILIGDSAYPLSPWLMKKFDNNNLNDAQRNFNRQLMGVRQVVERCIGVLKTRFRCILGERVLRYNPTRVGFIIYSCATLHNFLIANRFDVLHEIDQNVLRNLMNRREHNVIQQQGNNRQVALDRRNQVANFLQNIRNE